MRAGFAENGEVGVEIRLWFLSQASWTFLINQYWPLKGMARGQVETFTFIQPHAMSSIEHLATGQVGSSTCLVYSCDNIMGIMRKSNYVMLFMIRILYWILIIGSSERYMNGRSCSDTSSSLGEKNFRHTFTADTPTWGQVVVTSQRVPECPFTQHPLGWSV